MSYSTKALSLFIVLPLILRSFSAEEVSVWYLISSIITLMGLADFGFRNTFVRVISFAFGGAKHIRVQKGDSASHDSEPNWSLLDSINSNMKKIYVVLSALVFLLLMTLGTWSMNKPIALAGNSTDLWWAWGIVVFTTGFQFYGTIYQNYLLGLFKVALVRRIEALMALGAISTTLTVLLLGGSILHLVIAMQTWALLNVTRNWYLARTVEEGRYVEFGSKPFDKDLFWDLWSPAWRTGVSGLMSNGLTQLTGILYAQIGTASTVAALLLAIKLITQIKEVSMAPFYSKIPYMAKLRVQGSIQELTAMAQKGMLIGHLVFVSGVIVVGVSAEQLLNLIGSDTPFVTLHFWVLLSLAYYAHRYGAMHMQLYLTTNHVVSHIADGVSGLLFAGTAFLLLGWLDIYAIPLGMLVGYLAFYAAFAAYFSLKSVNMRFLEFERKAALPSVVLLVLFLACIFAT